MFNNTFRIINEFRKDRKLSEAYINAYSNQSSYKNGTATPDYIKYMTKSLINRGILCTNSELIDKIYKSSFEELLNEDFKSLFLHNSTRDIEGVYTDVTSIKNLKSIGAYDLLSSLVGAIPAKFFPSFEMGDIDISKIELSENNVSQEEIRDIVTSRDDYVAPDPIYRLLTEEEYNAGPVDGENYFTYDQETDTYNDILEFLPSDDIITQYFGDPVDVIYVKHGDDGEIVPITDEEYTAGPVDGCEYYKMDDTGEDTVGFVEYTNIITDISHKISFYESLGEVYIISDSEPEYTLDMLTDEEKNTLRAKFIGPQLNKHFEYYVKQPLIQIKEMFGKYSIWEMTSSVNMESDKYQTAVYQILYSNILNFIAYMIYCVNMVDIIDIESCDILKMLNTHISKTLSGLKTVGDMIPVETYVNNVIFNNIPDEYQKYSFYRLKIMDPVCDNQDFERNVSIQEATMTFTENLINFRQMLDITDLATVSNETAFWLTMLATVLFIQTVYMSSYYSQYKSPITMSVKTLMKRFTPSYDKLISLEVLDKFIDLTEINKNLGESEND